MYKRLQWHWLNFLTWDPIPKHIIEETRDLLGRIPLKIDHDARVDVALQLQEKYLESATSDAHRAYIRKLWTQDEYPLVRRLYAEKRKHQLFRKIVNDPTTLERLLRVLPIDYTIMEITPVFRATQLIVELYPSRIIPEVTLPPDLKPFVVFCPWASTFIDI